MTLDEVIDRFDGSLAYSTNSKEMCQYIADLLKELKERRKEQYITIEQIATAVGSQTIHSAYLWSEFARVLYDLGYAVVERRTE